LRLRNVVGCHCTNPRKHPMRRAHRADLNLSSLAGGAQPSGIPVKGFLQIRHAMCVARAVDG
jgi:hypothetical protein